MTRYFWDFPLEVETDRRGFPLQFWAKGRKDEVLAIANWWRADRGWWRPRPIHRTYFKVLTKGGVLCVIDHDDKTGTWYFEGDFDGKIHAGESYTQKREGAIQT